MLPFLVEWIPDLIVGTALDAEGQLLRIVSGKDHRTVDEMFRDSKRARETSQYWLYQGANELPRLLDRVGRSQDKKNKLPWNVVARRLFLVQRLLPNEEVCIEARTNPPPGHLVLIEPRSNQIKISGVGFVLSVRVGGEPF